jgi:hypothetical protein
VGIANGQITSDSVVAPDANDCLEVALRPWVFAAAGDHTSATDSTKAARPAHVLRRALGAGVASTVIIDMPGKLHCPGQARTDVDFGAIETLSADWRSAPRVRLA